LRSFAAALIALGGACDEPAAAGTEGGPCIRNLTCDPGLACLAGLCELTVDAGHLDAEVPDTGRSHTGAHAAAEPDAGPDLGPDLGPDTGPADSGPSCPPIALDGGLHPRAACGEAAWAPCDECRGIDECGRGRPNAVPVSFCEHCPLRADREFCEAGRCRSHDLSGHVRGQFELPEPARGSEGFVAVTFSPITADGRKLTCADLLGTCTATTNVQLNVGSSRFQHFGQPGTPGLLYSFVAAADVGDDRLLFVTVTERNQGNGRITGVGCAEGLSVTSGGMLEVPLTVRTP